MAYVKDPTRVTLGPAQEIHSVQHNADGSKFYLLPPHDAPRSRVIREHHGWRTGPGIPEPITDPPIKHGGTWASSTRAVLAATDWDSIPDPSTRTTSLPVHNREWKETVIPTRIQSYSVSRRGVTRDIRFAIHDPKSNPSYLPPQEIPRWDPSLDNSVVEDLMFRLRATRPTRPDANLGQALVELREFPRLVNTVREIVTFKALRPGSTYLSYQFGFAPLGQDIARAASSVLNFQKKWKTFLDGSGELHSRKVWAPTKSYSLETKDSTQAMFLVHGLPSASRVWQPGTDSWEVRETASAFCLWEYFLGYHGLTPKLEMYAQKAEKLLGLTLTPSLIWELAPWSWLVDWFADVGGFISYHQDIADYSLAMRRAGVMYQREVAYTRRATFTEWGQTVPVEHTVFQTQKVRRKARSPYGIRTNWDELSSFQLSILAALGLSRRGW